MPLALRQARCWTLLAKQRQSFNRRINSRDRRRSRVARFSSRWNQSSPGVTSARAGCPDTTVAASAPDDLDARSRLIAGVEVDAAGAANVAAEVDESGRGDRQEQVTAPRTRRN